MPDEFPFELILYVEVKYVKDTVIIEWLGTHAEYDKKKFGVN